jgi:hypothetical protein
MQYNNFAVSQQMQQLVGSASISISTAVTSLGAEVQGSVGARNLAGKVGEPAKIAGWRVRVAVSKSQAA